MDSLYILANHQALTSSIKKTSATNLIKALNSLFLQLQLCHQKHERTLTVSCPESCSLLEHLSLIM